MSLNKLKVYLFVIVFFLIIGVSVIVTVSCYFSVFVHSCAVLKMETVGRPAKVAPEDFKNVVLLHKDRIVIGSGRIAAKKNHVWSEISRALDDKLAAVSIYTMVTVNKYNVKNLLLDIEENECEKIPEEDSTFEADSSLEVSGREEGKKIEFKISIAKDEFNDMVEEKTTSSPINDQKNTDLPML